MKKIAACLFFASLVSAAVAQTNAAARTMSLPDCLAAALKHNFDVQVQRYEPQKSLLNLNAAYAGYDPVFSLSGTRGHNLNNASGGVFTNGTTTTALASPSAGYRFVNWTENGAAVSTATAYTFTNIVNRSLLATFVPAPTLSVTRQPTAFLLAWSTNFPGYTPQQNTNLSTTNWTKAAETVSTAGTNYQATIQTTNGPRLFRLIR